MKEARQSEFMNSMGRMASLFLMSMTMLLAVLTPLPPAYSQETNKDYFSVTQPSDKTLLRDVEKYHLGPDKFWKWYTAKKFHYAVQELAFVLRYFPNHPKALQLMGAIGIQTEDPSLAIPYFENALRFYPQYAITYAQYGRYLVDTGNIHAGIRHLKKATEMDPGLARAFAELAKAYAKSGSPDLARQAAAKARELGYGGRIDGQAEGD